MVTLRNLLAAFGAINHEVCLCFLSDYNSPWIRSRFRICFKNNKNHNNNCNHNHNHNQVYATVFTEEARRLIIKLCPRAVVAIRETNRFDFTSCCSCVGNDVGCCWLLLIFHFFPVEWILVGLCGKWNNLWNRLVLWFFVFFYFSWSYILKRERSKREIWFLNGIQKHTLCGDLPSHRLKKKCLFLFFSFLFSLFSFLFFLFSFLFSLFSFLFSLFSFLFSLFSHNNLPFPAFWRRNRIKKIYFCFY